MSEKKIYITADEIDVVTCETECQETTLNWYRSDKIIVVNSSDNTFITKMKRAMEKDSVNYKCYYYETNRDSKTGKLTNYFFEMPKELLCLRAERTKQELTEEERKERGRRLHQSRK